MIPDVAAFDHIDLAAAVADHDNVLHIKVRLLQRLVHISFQLNGAAAANAVVSRDHHMAVAVTNTPGKGIGGKAAKNHGMNGADAGTGQHGKGRLRNHRHINGHPVAFFDPMVFQHIGKTADFLIQLAIGDAAASAKVIALKNKGDLVGPMRQMPVYAVDTDIQRAVFIPADMQIILIIGHIFNPGVGFDPCETFAHFSPESFRIIKGPLIHFPVLILINEGVFGNFRMDRIGVDF